MTDRTDNDSLFRLKQTGFSISKQQDSYRCCMCHRMQPKGFMVTVPNDLLHGKHTLEQVALALAATPGSGGGCCVPCAVSLLPSRTEINGRNLRSPSELRIYD